MGTAILCSALARDRKKCIPRKQIGFFLSAKALPWMKWWEVVPHLLTPLREREREQPGRGGICRPQPCQTPASTLPIMPPRESKLESNRRRTLLHQARAEIFNRFQFMEHWQGAKIVKVHHQFGDNWQGIPCYWWGGGFSHHHWTY